MLDAACIIAPALYEAGFVSSAHSAADIAETVEARAKFFALPEPSFLAGRV
jgi:glutamate-1-semialdehyde 2,1-aminomutase